MKHISTFTVIVAVTMIISACGAAPVPTVNPVDVQNTAVAAAFTIVAETQAAIPTATSLPPTETPTQTPMATNTPLVLPTLNVTLTTAPVAVANTPGGDPCATRIIGVDMAGRETIIRIANTTKGAIGVSIYLNETPMGACGYRSYNIGKSNDVVIRDVVQGCYNIWAWAADSAKEKFQSRGYGCINNSDKWTFEVSASTVKFIGP